MQQNFHPSCLRRLRESGSYSNALRSGHRTAAPTTKPRSLHIRALFTGIVQGKAKVSKVNQQIEFSSLQIEFPDQKIRGAQIGASVAINGTCLTVTNVEGDVGHFDIIAETLRATNLGQLKEESHITFERSARVGDEIGGHNVSGHVHTTAEVVDIKETENNKQITFKVPRQWMKYILPKGFIAVDGISLTVGEVGDERFCVYLIPETLRATTLGEKLEGDFVNIEIDSQTQAIVDTVEQIMERQNLQRR